MLKNLLNFLRIRQKLFNPVAISAAYNGWMPQATLSPA